MWEIVSEEQGLIKLYLVVRESESSVLTRGTELLVGNYSHVAYLPLRDSQEDKTPYGVTIFVPPFTIFTWIYL